METGLAAGEMRLSFKGSAGDTLKLPITNLVHASVSLQKRRRGGERGKGEEWHEGKEEGTTSALYFKSYFHDHRIIAGSFMAQCHGYFLRIIITIAF